MLEHCSSLDELVKVGNTEYDKFKQMAVLKEKIKLDMSLVIQDSRQFDMTKGLSKDERVSKAQQAAENCITFGEVRHGCPGAFNFSDDCNSMKTTTPNKKAGEREVSSVSGKTLAEDICSVAGDTTVPVQKGSNADEEYADSFDFSIESNEPPGTWMKNCLKIPRKWRRWTKESTRAFPWWT